MNKSKILVVAPFPVDPPDAGNRARVASLIAALQACGHEVHFAHLQTGGYDGEAMERRMGAGRLHLLPYHAQPPERSRLGRVLRKAGQRLGVDQAFVWSLDSWYADAYTPLLAALHERHRFNAVLVNYVFMTKAFEAFDGSCLHILDTHDNMAMRHRNYQMAGMRPHWFSTTRAEEDRGLRRADVVMAIQDQEATEFGERLGGHDRPKIITVGHLLDLPVLAPLAERPSAVFVGSYNPINIHGLEHFLKHIHPLVRDAVPAFELIVAGSAAQEIADQPGLVKLGFVADLDDVFRSAMTFVSPVYLGTGVAIKLLDAMAHGMPCVCTRSGGRGMGQEGDAIDIVADDEPLTFAKRLIDLLLDPSLRQRRRISARAAAETWNHRQFAALSELLRTLPPDDLSLIRTSTRA